MRPTGALIAPTSIEDDAYTRLKAEIEQSYMGPSGAGRPLFLEGGLKWQQIGLNPAEAEWLDGMNATRQRIAMLFGIPPEIIGDAEHKTYNSYKDARKAFYEEGVMPILDSIRDDYNLRLVPLFDDTVELDYDRDLIEAIQEDRERLWRRLRFANWLSVNEKRQQSNYDRIEDSLADVPMAFLGDTDSDPEPVLDQVPGKPEGQQGSNGSLEDIPEEDDEGRVVPTEDAEGKLFTPTQNAREERKAKLALESVLQKHFGDQGAALVKHVAKEINKL